MRAETHNCVDEPLIVSHSLAIFCDLANSSPKSFTALTNAA